ncbi:hypothetical protein V2G26_013881 [Clonostachys chloroleuca]
MLVRKDKRKASDLCEALHLYFYPRGLWVQVDWTFSYDCFFVIFLSRRVWDLLVERGFILSGVVAILSLFSYFSRRRRFLDFHGEKDGPDDGQFNTTVEQWWWDRKLETERDVRVGFDFKREPNSPITLDLCVGFLTGNEGLRLLLRFLLGGKRITCSTLLFRILVGVRHVMTCYYPGFYELNVYY